MKVNILVFRVRENRVSTTGQYLMSVPPVVTGGSSTLSEASGSVTGQVLTEVVGCLIADKLPTHPLPRVVLTRYIGIRTLGSPRSPRTINACFILMWGRSP